MSVFDIVIAGGGYAGLMCATRLAARARRRGVSIALVNPSEMFVERLRLHEGLAAPKPAALRSFSIPTFLAKYAVAFERGSITSIDRQRRRLSIVDGSESPRQVGYRRLVLAVGSEPRRAAVPGAESHAYALEPEGRRSARELARVLAATERPRVLVIGAAATGTEVAVEIAGRDDAAVVLVDHGAYGSFTTGPVAKRLREAIARSGVTLVEHATVTRIWSDHAETSVGEVPFDICISCTGFAVPAVIQTTGLAMTHEGRVKVDGGLRALADRRVYAAGDAAVTALPCGAPPRMSVFYALCTGAHVADTIADELAGKPPRPFRFWTYGQAFGLGRRAIGFANFPHDRPLPPYYTGRAGYYLRRFFVWLLFGLLWLERAMPGLPFYLGRRSRPTSATTQGTAWPGS